LKKTVGVIIALLCFCLTAFAEIPEIPEAQPERDEFASRFLARYVTKVMNVANNSFPSDESNAVLQTRDGYMWFGGYSGLYRYDGAKFTVWDATTPGGFGSSNVRALYEDAPGTLWIGTNDRGLVSYANGVFTTYDKSAGLPSNTIRDIAEGKDGDLYCGTPEGIFKMSRDGTVTHVSFDTQIKQAVISLCFDEDGNLYAVLNSGELFVLTADGETVSHPYASQVYCVEAVSDNRVIAGTRDGDVLILRFGEGKFTRSDAASTPLSNIDAIYEDSNGYVWIASETGVGVLDGNEVYRHVGDPVGMGFYCDIFEDYQNNYWIASTKGGVVKLAKSAFSDYNALNCVETGTANAFLIDNGETYIGTNNGLIVLDKDGNPARSDLTGRANVRVRGIARDGSGNIWICTYADDVGVIRYNPKTNAYKNWTAADGMGGGRTRVACELPNGVMAIGTAEGINFIKGDDVISVYEAFGVNKMLTSSSFELPEIMVLSLTCSEDGTLYIGTDGDGVFAVNEYGSAHYREEDGLSGGVVLRMLPNPAGNGVFVSASPGLSYIDGDAKAAYPINKVPPYSFLDVMRYKDDLIMTTSGLIMRTNAADLLNAETPFTFTAVGQSSGLTAQINSNAWNLIDKNGDLYFCTADGVGVYGLENREKHMIPYAGVGNIEIDGVAYADFSGGVNIPREAERVTFELSLLSYGLLDDTALKYMLVGQDNAPVIKRKGDSLDISYTNLKGGDYTLQVWTESEADGKVGSFIEVNLHKDLKLLEHGAAWFLIVIFGGTLAALLIHCVVKYRYAKLAKMAKLEYEKEKAEAASLAKTNFLASMSHEIRTPMNAIIGIAQIQLQKGELPEEQNTAFKRIYNSGSVLLGIINDILDLSKIETGKMKLDAAEYDLPSLINDAVQLNIVRIGSKPIEFILDIDKELPSRLIGDELRLKQILNNLLSNAIKYTDKGYVKLTVSHAVRSDENTVLRFFVEDTGQGLKPEDKDKLFSEYLRFNAEANRTTEGTGIGLNITKKLVEMMDGEITAESEYGKGSVFAVAVMQKSVECKPIGEELSRKLRNFSFSGEKRYTELRVYREPMPYGRVLVVDDAETNLYVAEGLLSPYKIQVDTATSGFAAVKKIESGETYDVIFMDHMMPLMDGIETVKRLRALGYVKPIVALTANALTGNAEMFSQNGFDGFIAKPIDIRRLNEVLNKFVRRSEFNERQPVHEPPEIPEIPEKPAIPEPPEKPAPRTDKLFQVFCRDARKAIVTLRETAANGDIKLFTITAHGMKSALANIGETAESKTAARLEKAGNDGDVEFIKANAESFVATLEELIKDAPPEPLPKPLEAPKDAAFVAEQLGIAKAACENYDDAAAYAALDKLKGVAEAEEIRDMLFLHSDFDGAAERIAEILEGSKVKC